MTIQLTNAAVERIKEKLQERQRGLGLKVSIKKTGCSGFAYTIEFADDPLLESEAVETVYDEFSIWVDHLAVPYLEGSVMDWAVKGLNQGFEFVNPNEKYRCGCGKSFTV